MNVIGEFLIISVIFYTTNSIKPPCSLRGAGIICLNDEDCDGCHSVCLKGLCSCPASFEQFALDKVTQVCRPAPSKVGANCSTACRPPLLCQKGACVCYKANNENGRCVVNCPSGQTLVNHECHPASSVGGKCSDDADCSTPFTYCRNGACACVPGTRQSGSGCSAACPDGSQAGRMCRKTFVNDPNVYFNHEKMDTCPKGSHCVTYGKPDIGHCCPLYCPYGNADLSKSCKAGSSSSRCPELTTHYCQEFETKGGVDRLCCPRPCRDPTPLFLDGKCVPVSHWGDPCIKSEQCEGGSAMQCNSNGRCECKSGFAQKNSTFPTCEKNCGLGGVAVNGQCLKKVNVGDACVHNGQCPQNGHCREGVCECDCHFVIRGGGCMNPDDPLNVGGIGAKLSQLLGGKGR